LTTGKQADVRRSAGRRFLWAGVVTLAALIMFIVFGPEESEIKEKFEYYGAPGELQIMPEISIEEGDQAVHQIPRSLQVQPPPANIEVEPEEPDDKGTVEVPPVNIQEPNQVDVASEFPREEAEVSEDQQVEMALPMQSNPDYYIKHMVRPEYPLGVGEEERRIPVITVTAVLFVGPDGRVTDAWIHQTNGSRHFVEETLKAVKQWEFGWKIDPGVGRQIVIPWRFKSPYFTPESGLR
jgi:TonB family protein